MKKTLLIAVVAMLAACTTAQQQSASTLLTHAKAQIANACAVVQPTLLNLAAAQPGDASIAGVVKANGEFCAGIASVDQTNAQTIINTTIPQLIAGVSSLPMDAGMKTTIQLALGTASIALSNFLMVYGQQVAAPAPASGVVL